MVVCVCTYEHGNVNKFDILSKWCFSIIFNAGHRTSVCGRSLWTAPVNRAINLLLLRQSLQVSHCYSAVRVSVRPMHAAVAFTDLYVNFIASYAIQYCPNLLCIHPIVFWYSNQMACVRWRNSTSSAFHIGNGTKQGGVVSCHHICLHIYVISSIIKCGVGCHVGE